MGPPEGPHQHYRTTVEPAGPTTSWPQLEGVALRGPFARLRVLYEEGPTGPQGCNGEGEAQLRQQADPPGVSHAGGLPAEFPVDAQAVAAGQRADGVSVGMPPASRVSPWQAQVGPPAGTGHPSPGRTISPEAGGQVKRVGALEQANL